MDNMNRPYSCILVSDTGDHLGEEHFECMTDEEACVQALQFQARAQAHEIRLRQSDRDVNMALFMGLLSDTTDSQTETNRV